MSYRRGRRLEYRVRDDLKRMGAELVVRSAGSRGPCDLVAIFPDRGEIWLVQVKSTRRAERELEILKKLEGTYRVRAVVLPEK